MAPQHVPRIVAVALLGCLALFFMIASLNTAARSTFAQGSAKVSLFDRYERHSLKTENEALKAQLQALTERMEQRNSASMSRAAAAAARLSDDPPPAGGGAVDTAPRCRRRAPTRPPAAPSAAAARCRSSRCCRTPRPLPSAPPPPQSRRPGDAQVPADEGAGARAVRQVQHHPGHLRQREARRLRVHVGLARPAPQPYELLGGRDGHDGARAVERPRHPGVRHGVGAHDRRLWVGHEELPAARPPQDGADRRAAARRRRPDPHRR